MVSTVNCGQMSAQSIPVSMMEFVVCRMVQAITVTVQRVSNVDCSFAILESSFVIEVHQILIRVE